MDVFSIGLQLAFAAVFVVVLLRYLRDRRPVNRDLVFVAGSVAGWFVLSTLNTLVPAIGTSVVRLSALFIFIQPVLTLRLVRHFVPVRRNLVLAAVAWSVVALIVSYAVGTRGNPLTTGVVVGYFVFFESVGAVLLARAARSRVGYASTRLWVASIGTVLFAATVLVAGIGGASTPPGEPLNATLTFLSRLLALSAGLSYLVAFMPPQPLRRLQQRATAFDFGQSLSLRPTVDPRRSGRSSPKRPCRSPAPGARSLRQATRPSSERSPARHPCRSPSATRQPSAMPRSRMSRAASRSRSGPKRRSDP